MPETELAEDLMKEYVFFSSSLLNDLQFAHFRGHIQTINLWKQKRGLNSLPCGSTHGPPLTNMRPAPDFH